MDKKNMYIVMKREDVKKYLSKEEFSSLMGMLTKICDKRYADNKKPDNRYYVCNTDEPYADSVYQVILGGEALKNSKEEYSKNTLGSGSSSDTWLFT